MCEATRQKTYFLAVRVVFLAAPAVFLAAGAVFFTGGIEWPRAQRFLAVLAVLAVAFLAGALAAAFLPPAFLAGAADFLAPPLVFSADLKAAAGAKRTPLDAAIFTGAPVCGLRPVRAARDVGLKVPNPKMLTRLPALVSAITASRNTETADSACFFSSPVLLATSSTNSDLFTATSWRLGKFR